MQGISGLGLTALGWAYLDVGRWDEAQEIGAEAACLAEAKQMELVAASADLIAATVLAMRGDSGAARQHADRGACHRRSSRMRASSRPGPVRPRNRGPRRR